MDKNKDLIDIGIDKLQKLLEECIIQKKSGNVGIIFNFFQGGITNIKEVITFTHKSL